MIEVASVARPAIAHGPDIKLPPGPKNLAARIAERVAATPDGIVRVYDASGDHKVRTCSEIWRRSADIAAALHRAGARPTAIAILLIDDPLDLIAGFWACFRSGCTVVSLTGAAKDAERYGNRTLNETLDLLERPYVLADDHFSDSANDIFRGRGATIVPLQAVQSGSVWQDIDEVSDPASLIPTSGSTGGLKLASLTHSQQIYRYFSKFIAASRQHPDILNIFPLDGITGMQAAFLIHRRWTQMPSSILTTRPSAILDAIEQFDISSASLTNTVMRRILADEAGQDRNRNLSALRAIGIGGEPIARDVMNAFGKLLQRHGAPADIIHAGYGTTETGGLVRGSTDFKKDDRETVLLGKPASGIAIRIAENGRVLSEGEIGDVEVRCSGKMFSGYWRAPALTQASITEDGWWRTGDLGELVDGQLALHGRAKEIYILYGRKFPLADIDAEIAAVLDAGDIAHACAVTLPGKSTEQLAIVFCAASNAPERRKELSDRLRSSVARRFGLHADPIIATGADLIPRTTGGKLRRSELGRMIAAGELTVRGSGAGDTSSGIAQDRPIQTSPPVRPAFARGEDLKLSSKGPMNLAARLANRVSEIPDGIFRIYDPSGDHQTRTYGDLWRRSGDIASTLRNAGAGRSSIVLLLIDDMFDFIASYWACLRAGAVAVPLMSAARGAVQSGRAAFSDALAIFDKPWALADDSFSDIANDLFANRVVPLASVSADRWTDDFDTISDPACLIATSGSTGRPKFAMLTHSAQIHRIFAASLVAQAQALRDTLGVFPLDTVGGLRAGGMQYQSWTQIPAAVLVAKPTSILDAIEEFRISRVTMSNTMVGRILAEEARQTKERDLSSLRLIGLGSEPIVMEVITSFGKLLERHGAPAGALRTIYGTTETETLVTRAFDFEAGSGDGVRLGTPVSGVEIRIVDDNGDVLPEGTIGEVEIRCPQQMFSGYWGDPALGKALLTEDGWWKTGDLGELVDGQLGLHGRSKDTFIQHSRKFSLADIDAELSKALQQGEIAHACAIQAPDGASEQLAIVYCVAHDNPRPAETPAQLRSIVSRRFGLHADPIISVEPHLVPRTPAGKVRRSELARMIVAGELPRTDAESGQPSPITTAASTFHSPRQKMLDTIWCDVFALTGPPDPQANFFDLGGDSLRSLTLYLRIKDEFDVEIESDAFFQNPTLNHLSALVRERISGKDRAAAANSVSWPLSPAIRNPLMALLETWPGQRPTQDRVTIGANVLGRRPPIFWVCNELREFQALARELDTDQPLYALHSGVNLIPHTEDSTQALALRYISEISEVCPDGPFFIGGNCRGALVALALAQHALRRRHHVPLLVLMDWTFQLQPYAGRVLLVPGRTHDPTRSFAQPELAWRRAFADFQMVESSAGYALQDGAIGDFGRVLKKAMESAVTRPLPLMPSQGYRATISAEKVPSQLKSEEHQHIEVTVRNDSDIGWGPTGDSGLVLSSRWTDPDGDLFNQVEPHAELPAIAPHASARVRLAIHAPAEAADYKLHLDLLESGNRWFHPHPTSAFHVPVSVRGVATADAHNSAGVADKSGSVHEYVFNAHAPTANLLVHGWSGREDWGVWSDGRVAKVRLPLDTSGARWRVVLKCRAFGPRGRWLPVRVRAGFDGDEIAWKLPARWTVKRTIDFHCSGRYVTLRFSMPAATSPQELGLGDDRRKLGLALIAVRIRRIG